jgi:hypothetical protein
MTLESLFVLFIFCNSTDTFDVGVDGLVFMLADFSKALCYLLLAILATYSGNTVWCKKQTYVMGGGNT